MYRPELSLWNYHFFRPSKKILKCTVFAISDEVRADVAEHPYSLLKVLTISWNSGTTLAIFAKTMPDHYMSYAALFFCIHNILIALKFVFQTKSSPTFLWLTLKNYDLSDTLHSVSLNVWNVITKHILLPKIKKIGKFIGSLQNVCSWYSSLICYNRSLKQLSRSSQACHNIVRRFQKI